MQNETSNNTRQDSLNDEESNKQSTEPFKPELWMDQVAFLTERPTTIRNQPQDSSTTTPAATERGTTKPLRDSPSSRAAPPPISGPPHSTSIFEAARNTISHTLKDYESGKLTRDFSHFGSSSSKRTSGHASSAGSGFIHTEYDEPEIEGNQLAHRDNEDV